MSNPRTRALCKDKMERLKGHGEKGFTELEVRERNSVAVVMVGLEGWEQEWSSG